MPLNSGILGGGSRRRTLGTRSRTGDFRLANGTVTGPTRGGSETGGMKSGPGGSNPASSPGESTANLSFRVGIASMTVGCEEIRRARHRHVTVGAYYKRAVRRLAQEATMPAPRDRLADVALQYEKLAEGAHAGCRHPGSCQERIAPALTGS